MLKCAFNFQDPRGACFLCCGGTFSTKVYLAIACFLYASEEEYVVDSWWLFKYVWIYQSYSDFLCRLSIGFGTHWWWFLHLILQQAWNWRGGGTRPYLFSLWICFIHFVFSFSCFASFLTWRWFRHFRPLVLLAYLIPELWPVEHYLSSFWNNQFGSDFSSYSSGRSYRRRNGTIDFQNERDDGIR